MTDWTTLNHNAYTPYSNTPKACVIQSRSGRFYRGVRIENTSYPLTISAIQAACCICLSEGEVPSKLFIEQEKYDQLDYWTEELSLDVIQKENLPDVEPHQLQKTIPDDLDSLGLLKDLLSKAVIPNSDFPVSAILFCENGYFEGVNVEVSDWSMGLCAERVALAKAISEGVTDFKSMEIHTRYGEVSSPCGACRQVLVEHLPYHKVRLHHADGTHSEHLTVDLLPFGFKTSALK